MERYADWKKNISENKLKQSEEIEKENNPKRIAYFKETLFHPGLDAEIKTKIETYFKDLEAKGYIVEAIDFSLLSYLVPTYYVLTTAEASSNLSRFDGIRFGHQSTSPVSNLNDFYLK